MQFLQAMNWMRTSLPPFRKNRAIPPASWTESRLQAWVAAKGLTAHAVTLFHPRPDCQVLMYPDASECDWGIFVTQVPEVEI
ncbi:unnamed protein product [Sphacelaria rigidula]